MTAFPQFISVRTLAGRRFQKNTQRSRIDDCYFPLHNTTLILVPSHLIDQWENEIDKFLPSKRKSWKVLIIKNVCPLQTRSVRQLMEFDIILVTYRLLYSEVYQTRLCELKRDTGTYPCHVVIFLHSVHICLGMRVRHTT